MVISDVAKKFNLNQNTLRYYEKEGLIGPVKKSAKGIRDYDEEDLKRIEFVKCMRNAGLEITVLRKYIDLLEQGDTTLVQRKELLIEQKRQIHTKVKAMQKALDKLNKKIDMYDSKKIDAYLE